MKDLLLMVLAALLVCFGCASEDNTSGGDADTDTDSDSDTDTDTDTDTDSDECNLGEYPHDFDIYTQSDAAALAGYTSISGDLYQMPFVHRLERVDLPHCGR